MATAAGVTTGAARYPSTSEINGKAARCGLALSPRSIMGTADRALKQTERLPGFFDAIRMQSRAGTGRGGGPDSVIEIMEIESGRGTAGPTEY